MLSLTNLICKFKAYLAVAIHCVPSMDDSEILKNITIYSQHFSVY
jgi:hypothetical protein